VEVTLEGEVGECQAKVEDQGNGRYLVHVPPELATGHPWTQSLVIGFFFFLIFLVCSLSCLTDSIYSFCRHLRADRSGERRATRRRFLHPGGPRLRGE
jgi:hypothetical protein